MASGEGVSWNVLKKWTPRKMALKFTPFRAEQAAAVRAFNQRMRAGKAATEFLIPEDATDIETSSESVTETTQYVALDGTEVRGGVIELTQPGWLNQTSVPAFNYQSPLSEALIDRKYGMVAVQMVKFMEKRGEAVFIVGMGNEANPMPRMLKASGWHVRPVPFLFRIHRARTFLREMQMLNSTAGRRIASRVAGASGAASLALYCLQLRRSAMKFKTRREKGWGKWADEIWEQCRGNCSFAVSRERRVLEELYPSDDPGLSLLVVEDRGNAIGWAACLDTRIRDGRYFGNMKLGCVLDCVGRPEAMAPTAIAADRELASHGADLVWLNHSHEGWVRAFRSAGFLPGPSNYLLGTSKLLTQAVRLAPGGEEKIHVTRGDGDGRANFVVSAR